MVFKQAVIFLSGAGLASFPIYWQMHQSLQKENSDIHKEFMKQRELLYQLKVDSFAGR